MTEHDATSLPEISFQPGGITAPVGVSNLQSPDILMGMEEDGKPRGAACHWNVFQEEVVPAIVALKVVAVRSFQDSPASSHGGTGFVVDADRGLLLTNRHVCTCGPQRASATFVGSPAMEEVLVHVAYIDPTHDFALLRFDPSSLDKTPKAQIQLNPAGCRVGEEVRVIGNDSLEKLQILSGTIARVDRNAPDLAGDYVDENTFYALAGSGTRGGSSGSPVLNRAGQAVALNAAALPGTMHGLFLPLHRVVRALDAVRQGDEVPRGTLCTALSYISFPECLRLGVSKDRIQDVLERDVPEGGTFTETMRPGGMLKVQKLIPGTQAARLLQPGDVLLRMNGEICCDFVLLDAMLDASVGKSIRLLFCRGGRDVTVELDVQDLHNLIPHAFIELALGVFHNIAYQTAMKHCIPLQGIYVAQAGFVFGHAVKSDTVILDLNGNPCTDLADFEDAVQQIADKEHFIVAWMQPKDAKERHRHESTAKMQRHFFATEAWTRNRSTCRWSPRSLAYPDACRSPQTFSKTSSTSDEELERGVSSASTTLPPSESPPSARSHKLEAPLDGSSPLGPPRKKRRSSMHRGALSALERSVCHVEFSTPQHFVMDLIIDASSIETDVVRCQGVGVIVDAHLGLVLTDRTTVPQSFGDVEVTLGDDTRSASVWFMHPTHSLVLLRVAPRPEDHEDGSSQPFGRDAVFEDHGFAAGDESDFVGIDQRGSRFCSQVEVQSVRLTAFSQTLPVRWRQRNVEAVHLKDNPEHALGGVLCDGEGRIHALYAYANQLDDSEVSQTGYGLPTFLILPLVEHIKSCGFSSPPAVPSLEVEFSTLELARLRRLPQKLRPSAAWLTQLSSCGKSVLRIAGITASGPLANGTVEEGDVLLAADGSMVVNVQQVETQLHNAMLKLEDARVGSTIQVKLTLLTRGKAREVTAQVPLLGDDGTSRLICWHGIILRETPRVVHEVAKVPAGVHIAQMLLGSPAEADGIEGDVLVAVNGAPTPTLDALLEVARGAASATGPQGGRRHLRVETADVSGRRFMVTLEPDALFWPTLEMKKDMHGSWSCSSILDERSCE